MRRIGDKIPSHPLDLHPLADIADQQQGLVGSIGDQTAGQPGISACRRGDLHHRAFSRTAQIGDEVRVPQQVLDTLAPVPARLEVQQQPCGRVVVQDLVLGIEDHTTVRKGLGGSAQLLDQPAEPLAATLCLGLDELDLGKHWRPDALAVGYLGDRACRQPAFEPVKVVEMPGQECECNEQHAQRRPVVDQTDQCTGNQGDAKANERPGPDAGHQETEKR